MAPLGTPRLPHVNSDQLAQYLVPTANTLRTVARRGGRRVAVAGARDKRNFTLNASYAHCEARPAVMLFRPSL